jgi:hypothetical protein
VGQQQVERTPGFGAPDHPLVDELAALSAQRVNDSRAPLEIVPEFSSVDAVEFFPLVSKQRAQLGVVEQQVANPATNSRRLTRSPRRRERAVRTVATAT